MKSIFENLAGINLHFDFYQITLKQSDPILRIDELFSINKFVKSFTDGKIKTILLH